MREFEEDFVNEEAEEFKIDDRIFGYKPTTAGQENDWANEYIEKNKDGIYQENIAKLNICKMRNLVKVPWNRETINKIVGIDKEWVDLNNEQRWQLLSKLKPIVFSQIIKKISKIDQATEKKT